MRSRKETAFGRLPTFLIVGAQKSGTTALSSVLGAHPDVFMSQRKELHFFDLNFDKGLTWYASHFQQARDQPQVGEATPSYLYLPLAIQRLADQLPDARLLVTLRNPVDRAYSHYWHNRARGEETLGFNEALDAESARLTDSDLIGRLRFSYMDRGCYLSQLTEVVRHFPRSSLHIAIAEETQADPATAAGRVAEFLGLDPELRPAAPVASGAYSEFRSTLVRELSSSLPDMLAKPMKRLNVRPSQQYPPMEPRVRARLEAFYEPSNRQLADFLGRPEIWPIA